MLCHTVTIAVLLLAGSQTPPATGTLKFTTPPGWQSREPSSTMRVAEFVLPGPPGASQDAELVIYYFGGSGGSVDANIKRWLSQMQQPDGRASGDVAVRGERTVNKLKISTLDVAGIYVAELRPGSGEKTNSPGFRMRTAIVETPRGPYFIKLVGPAKTLATWNDAFNSFLGSLNFA
jgi:hypothetical protein